MLQSYGLLPPPTNIKTCFLTSVFGHSAFYSTFFVKKVLFVGQKCKVAKVQTTLADAVCTIRMVFNLSTLTFITVQSYDIKKVVSSFDPKRCFLGSYDPISLKMTGVFRWRWCLCEGVARVFVEVSHIPLWESRYSVYGGATILIEEWYIKDI